MTPSRLQELGINRLDLLCGFLFHELGEASLRHAPALLSGFRSVNNSPLLVTHRIALGNLRRVCRGLNTQAALRAAAARYNDGADTPHTGGPRLFRIDERSLEFKSLFDLPSDSLRLALSELHVPDGTRPHAMEFANPAQPMFIRVSFEGEQRRYEVRGLPSRLPQPAQHAAAERKQRPLVVTWSDLLAQAREMDLLDLGRAGERPGNWTQRMSACYVASVGKDGVLLASEELTLHGIKHLIGLPGAGKTTLLVCLLRHLHLQGLRSAVFFPSIEVCRQYLETLERYGVKVGLLTGSSTRTRMQHASRLGEALAGVDPLRGFAQSSPGAPLIEGVCALPGLTQAPAEAFEVNSRFCTQVLQQDENGKFREYLCPAWSLCSAMRAQRELPQLSIWLGHVRSADTSVPAHSGEWRERYFEFIAREFDLVIFDEADKAQQDLDMTGLAQLQLSGYASSFHWDIQRHTLQQLAQGSNAALKNLDFAQLASDTAEFEKLNVALISAIQRLDDSLQRGFAGLLLTPLRLIGDWLSPRRSSGLAADRDRDSNARAKDALCSLWERAAIEAFQTREGQVSVYASEPSDEWQRFAQALARPAEDLAQLRRDLQQAFARWLNAPTLRARADGEAHIAGVLRPYTRQLEQAQLRLLVQLLLPVTFTVLMYRRLAARVNAMAHDGLVPAIRVEERCSDELLDATPDNLLGSLSGVRYHVRSRDAALGWQQDHIQLQYVIFSGAPRALLYHLHEWRDSARHVTHGPAVLLTSATSFLPESPASHIDVGPHYVLRRAGEEPAARASRYVFRPITDPERPETALRFSGERSEALRLRSLEKMVHALMEGGPSNSWLARDIREFDAGGGIPRKAALVVNSYSQSVQLKRYIDHKLPTWRSRVVAVTDEIPPGGANGEFVTAAGAEALGDRSDWDVLIFPMGALGRGTNIVFTHGPRTRDATLGSLYFLTRPHPSPEDLGFLVSLAARATQSFNSRAPLDARSLAELSAQLARARGQLYSQVGRLLRHPLYARALGDLFEPFTANAAVSLLQTIGRAMRNGCPVQCFFVDRAWAERSAQGEQDTPSTSMLVQLHELLGRGMHSADATVAALYRELYAPFYDALSDVEGLRWTRDLDLSAAPSDPPSIEPLWVVDDENTSTQEDGNAASA